MHQGNLQFSISNFATFTSYAKVLLSDKIVFNNWLCIRNEWKQILNLVNFSQSAGTTTNHFLYSSLIWKTGPFGF